MAYTVYILECSDGTLYTGSTKDIEKRIKEHNYSPRGAKYTSGRRPVKLVYQEKLDSLAIARSREAIIKNLSRKEKIDLINL